MQRPRELIRRSDIGRLLPAGLICTDLSILAVGAARRFNASAPYQRRPGFPFFLDGKRLREISEVLWRPPTRAQKLV